MKRRDVLERAAALGAAGALAGCVSQFDGGGDGGSNPDDGDGGGSGPDDGTDTTTTPVTPSVAGTEFVDSKSACGDGNEADIAWDDGAMAVRITGTLTAPDPCHNPSFAEANYDAEADELSVVVTAVEDPSADMCTQCLAKIDYEALVRFDGALPGSVSVGHMGMGGSETVASESR